MKSITALIIACFLVACGADKPIPPSVTPQPEAAPRAVEPQPEPVTVESGADPLGDVEWAPNSTDTLHERAEPVIDLDMGEGYKPVPKDEPLKCKTAKDCRGMSRPKMPGEIRCLKNECVFVAKPLRGEDIVEIL